MGEKVAGIHSHLPQTIKATSMHRLHRLHKDGIKLLSFYRSVIVVERVLNI
ncbi:hypothetical protein KIN20_013644 [Parelaphostrongylus tenuis]|uniref:Uncharacterized protein n=1 Tax=Parelaphostrongylus tenuis TaxID=148309 RepID=A0AAD5MYE8_PARTN|nr:hypothetical protein KIN20_013644 [Parelaphostrongylus tenuis]